MVVFEERPLNARFRQGLSQLDCRPIMPLRSVLAGGSMAATDRARRWDYARFAITPAQVRGAGGCPATSAPGLSVSRRGRRGKIPATRAVGRQGATRAAAGGRKAEAARRMHVPGPGGDRRYVPGEGCWQQTTSPIPRERPRLSVDGLRFHCWGIRHAGSTNAYRHLPPGRNDAESPSRRGTGPEPDVVHSQPTPHPRLTSIGRGL